jgi:CheY-like chemotaxis protein
MLTILCIDDDPDILATREVVLRAEGFHVLTANTGTKGLALANGYAIDLVVLDYSMPDMTGEEVARILKEQFPAMPIVLCSGYDVPESAFKQVDAFVAKADVPEFLLMTIKSVVGRKKPSKRQLRLGRTG